MPNQISCPKCSTSITVNTEDFLNGEKFECSNCDTVIGMQEPTDLTIEKLNELKRFSKMRKPGASSHVPCPDCGTPVPFSAQELVSGKPIECPSCKASIALQA